MLSPKHFIRTINMKNEKAFNICLNSNYFREKDFKEALVYCTFTGWLEGARKLLSRIDYDKPYLENEIPRMTNLSSTSGKMYLLNLLENFGANPLQQEDFPFHLSCTNGHADTSAYIILKGADQKNIERSIKKAYDRGFKELAMSCLFLKMNMKTQNDALEWAIKKNNNKFIEASLIAGANPNLKDGDLIFKCIYENKIEALNLLVKFGGDVLIRGDRVFFESAKNTKDKLLIENCYSLFLKAKKEPTIILKNEKPRIFNSRQLM